MRLIAILIGLVFLLSSPASAIKSPRLPSTAKKLTAAEIVRLYDGHTMSFSNFTLNKPLSGEVSVSFKTKTITGTYVFGDDKGTFKGTIRMKGDYYCYNVGKKSRGEVCGRIYSDGRDIYEVNSMGKVIAKNRILR
jgi:hypothetical protein